MGCAFEDELTAYVDGELPAARAREVEGHLASCAPCRTTEALLRRTVARLAALPAPAFAPNPRLRRELLERLEAPEHPLLAWLKSLLRPLVLVPSLGAVAAAVIAAGVVTARHREAPELELASSLEVASNMEVLEDYDVAGIDSPDDVEVVQQLNELEVKP